MKKEYIHPNFASQLDFKKQIGECIAENARFRGLSYQEYSKKHSDEIKSVVGDFIRESMPGRVRAAKTNTAEFFVSVYAHLFGGEIKSSKTKLCDGFNPDIRLETADKIVHTEIKSISTRGSSPLLPTFQFNNYCEDFFKLAINGNPNCGVDYGFFKYGSKEPQKLYQYELNGLVKKVSENIRSLVIFPLNVLMAFLSKYNLIDYDHTSSIGRDIECYWRPLGGDFTKVTESPAFVEEVLQRFEDRGISREVLCADGLKREEFMSPNNLFCRQYKIKPFKIVRYSNADLAKWAKSFASNYYELFDKLGLDAEDFKERVSKSKSDSDDSNLRYIPVSEEQTKDSVPF